MLFNDKHKFVFKHDHFWHLVCNYFGHNKYTLIEFIKEQTRLRKLTKQPPPYLIVQGGLFYEKDF